ncbi:hypothetical protein INT48_004228 [Thamnidium elegans]|uniref:Uncharacterized protein n=1 Tax=Thamnidium elegans TaxID=101142 RepID=A0A8H7SK29_9FUNG|nr:hypothetical protein INT48_004228 [Thamnidium elegans]
MTQWETIQDRSSHISPTRLSLPKNHSTKRGKDIFDDTTYYIQKIQDTPSFVTSHVTQPFVSNLQTVWKDLTKDEFVYTPIRIMHKYYETAVLPMLKYTKECLHVCYTFITNELDSYINPNLVVDDTAPEMNIKDYQIEEKIKKTARRILDYMDLTQRTGMEQEEARDKAQEIIKSLKLETNLQETELLQVKETDIVSFEIKAIMQVAKTERSQLKQQLELLQSRLVNEKDTDLVISALKLEIDQLRATAENNVRKRTEQALSRLDQNISPYSSIGIQEIQQARRDALKELRFIYRDIYQINQVIDNTLLL